MSDNSFDPFGGDAESASSPIVLEAHTNEGEQVDFDELDVPSSTGSLYLGSQIPQRVVFSALL